jgi:UDP-N-acetylglucosamine diphosphorylase/glucosamine-1-phosphate N-acetyltransferase
MSNVIIFEDHAWRNFLPLTYWRPVCRLRCGRYPLMERLSAELPAAPTGLWMRDAIASVAASRHGLPVNQQAAPDAVLLNARWLPMSGHVLQQIEAAPCPGVGMLGDEVAYIRCDGKLAAALSAGDLLDADRTREALSTLPRVPAKGLMVGWPWDLVLHNGDLLLYDWDPAKAEIKGTVQPGAHLINERSVHVGAGSVVKSGAVLDADQGPIYIGENVTIMPNAVVCGPTFIGDGSLINAGAWIRTNVSIGPGCRVGGEVGASIIHALANKQHHGFLGHSYVAEWVNIGAGTTTSNLKNTYGEINVPICGVPTDSGQSFVGSIIGDFAKIGINQSLATGSVIGFGSSLATSSINAPFVSSFRFVTDRKDEPYDSQRCFEVAQRSMARRAITMSPEEQEYFRQLPALAEQNESL